MTDMKDIPGTPDWIKNGGGTTQPQPQPTEAEEKKEE
jgi:hypothetical protein